ncbi:MAG: hypothetical protein ACFB50_11620 [Rubrobacteraceae bacterium]
MLGKMFRRLVFLGVLVGVAVALRSYLSNSEAPGEEAVQISFDDGSTQVLTSRSVEAQEFTDIARKIVEIGL